MSRECVERRDGGYWVTGSRVSLDSVVHAYLQGQTPETIAESFPVLSLAAIDGAIAFYRSHQGEMDAYLAKSRLEYEARRKALGDADRRSG